MAKFRWYCLVGGVLLSGLLGTCQTDPIGQTLKTFFEDLIRQSVAAAIT